MRPMPTRRGARHETNAKRITSIGVTVAKISPKRCGGARVWKEYAFCSEKTHFGLHCEENTLSNGESVFRACGRQNALSKGSEILLQNNEGAIGPRALPLDLVAGPGCQRPGWLTGRVHWSAA